MEKSKTNKKNCIFIQINIKDFYSFFDKKLLNNAIIIAKNYVTWAKNKLKW